MGSTPKCSDLKHKISQPEELPFSVGTPVRTAITVLVAAPEFLRHSCPPVIPAKAGILIRIGTSCAAHRPDPHQRLQDIQTQKNPYFKRLSRVVDGNSMTLINSISR